MIKESGIVERIPSNPADLLMLCMADPVEAATLIAELQAEREQLRLGYRAIMEGLIAGRVGGEDVVWYDKIETLFDFCDAMINGNEPRDFHELHSLQERAHAAESSLHRVRGETIEECAKVVENLIFPVLSDQMTTRELIKIQRDQISARIRSLNITGLDTGAVKTGAAG